MSKRCVCGHSEADHAMGAEYDQECVQCPCAEFTPEQAADEEPGYVFD